MALVVGGCVCICNINLLFCIEIVFVVNCLANVLRSLLCELVEFADNAGVIVNPKGEMKGMVKHMELLLLKASVLMVPRTEPFKSQN